MPRALRISRAAFERLWSNPLLTNADISRLCGARMPSFASTAAKRFGLPPKRPGKKVAYDAKEFIAMWTAGVRTDSMAEVFGRPRATIAKEAVRLGLTPRYPGQRCKVTLADYRAAQLREAMAATARDEQAAALAMWRAA